MSALTRPDVLKVVAVDGKTLRGSATTTEAAVHLLTALTPDRYPAAQVRVPARASEIDAVCELLRSLDLSDAVVTADALHTQTETARGLVQEHGAHYVLAVKANQKTLLECLKALPWAQVPTLDTTRHRGHVRARTRTVKALTLTGQTGFPYAAQAVRVRRHVTDMRTGKTSWTCAYAVTSLEAGRAEAARLGSAR